MILRYLGPLLLAAFVSYGPICGLRIASASPTNSPRTASASPDFKKNRISINRIQPRIPGHIFNRVLNEFLPDGENLVPFFTRFFSSINMGYIPSTPEVSIFKPAGIAGENLNMRPEGAKFIVSFNSIRPWTLAPYKTKFKQYIQDYLLPNPADPTQLLPNENPLILDLSQVFLDQEMLLQIVKAFPRAVELRTSQFTITDWEPLTQLTDLKRLVIEGSLSSSIHSFLTILAKLPRLESLELRKNAVPQEAYSVANEDLQPTYLTRIEVESSSGGFYSDLMESPENQFDFVHQLLKISPHLTHATFKSLSQVRHHPLRGWLDELDRLKGGRFS